MSKEQARATIAKLVDDFRQDTQHHKRNEQETRLFYILPLFEALGWNTRNPAEFTAEEQISRGFVDFGFYLNGVPVFYLETKRMTGELSKPKNIMQSINYSFLKGVTWAVLTDFERLMVFNANWEAKDLEKARFLELHYSDFATTRFDDLWLLSREAFLGHEIDQVAERYGKKAIKQSVTESLFGDLTDWRRRLFAEIRGQKATQFADDSQLVDNAVQKFFDRLIFIRTIEDRQIEAPRLNPILRQHKPDMVFGKLLDLFRELDLVYNSNLFAQHPLDTMRVYDPSLIAEIINGLYEQKGRFVAYDFNAITADVLGAVYEQYLGFKATDPDAKQDTSKNKKRKSQGIYYTPQYVVRYIVQSTLGKLLTEGADAHALRIIDPACGSGAFLIEAFDVLDRWLAQQEPHIPTHERRRRILLENLYGVDLDEQAVEVTRLNLMLRAAYQRDKLPLLTNIKHGNSLVDVDEVAGAGLGFDWATRFGAVFGGGSKSLWFVTFVTHNSRVSERMVLYGESHGEAVVFSPDEQLLIAEKIAEACVKYGIKVVAWNVLPDHVHMIIGAKDEHELSQKVQKIKGYSAYTFQRTLHREKGQSLWAQKFHQQIIQSDVQLQNVIEYVRNNHEKHQETWGERLQMVWEGSDYLISMGQISVNKEPIGTEMGKGLKPLVEISTDNVAQENIISPSSETPQDISITTLGSQSTPVPTPPNKGLQPLALDTLASNQTPQDTSITTLGSQSTPVPTPPNKGLQPLAESKPRANTSLRTIVERLCVSIDEATQQSGGFDVVIGNPPYGAELPTTHQEYIRKKYRVAQYQLDTYTLFFEKSHQILRDNAVCGFIVPSAWTASKYDKALREFLAHQTKIESMVIAPRNVFADATVETVVLTFSKQAPDDEPFQITRWDLEPKETHTLAPNVILSHPDFVFPIYAKTNHTQLIQRLKQELTTFDTVVDTILGVKIYQKGKGKPKQSGEEAKTRVFHAIQATKPTHRPLLGGKDISRYQLQWSKEFIDYGEWIAEPRIPEWFNGSRILIREITAQGVIQATLVEGDYVFSNSVDGVRVKKDVALSPHFILGIINSNLISFYHRNTSPNAFKGTFPKVLLQDILSFPIPRLDLNDLAQKAQHDDLVRLVEKILALKSQHTHLQQTLDDKRHEVLADINTVDQQIDTAVYELYGLTEEEITIVTQT